MSSMQKGVATALVGTLLLMLALITTSAHAQDAGKIGRVLLVGIDGADWNVIDELAARGEMPNFEQLMASGTHGKLVSLLPSWSPRIWTSIATGVLPETHSILGFVYQKDGSQHLFTSDMIAVPTLWEILNQRGVSVGVTNYWFTYPALPVSGYMISDHTIPSRSSRMNEVFSKGASPAPDPKKLVHPEALWETISPIVQRPSLDSSGKVGETSIEGSFLKLYNIMMEDEVVTDLALAADRVHHPRVTAVYLKGVDRASHAFWKFYRPDHELFAADPPTAREISVYGDWIPWVYRHTDELLGELRQMVGEDDVLIVVSDHSFTERKPVRNGAVSGTHGVGDSRDGIYLFSGRGIEKSQDRGPDISVLDISPTILHLAEGGVPGHMEGKVASALFEPSYLASHPVRASKPLSRADLSLSANRSVDSVEQTVPEEDERIEELRALGYFE